MASITATAFKWTGTHYNATYTNSHTVTITDDDSHYEGGTDANESVSIDGGAAGSTLSSPYAIDVSFTDTDGVSHVETFYFFNTAGDWYFIPGADSAFSEGAYLGGYQSHTVGWDYAGAVCFANGTHIETSKGPVAVETLKQGDLVRVFDGSFQPLRLHLVRQIDLPSMLARPELRPVLIAKGALGAGLPLRDLRVSRQHRILVNGAICQRMFSVPSVLVPAHRLTCLPGCSIELPDKPISYHHLVFEDHEIVFSEGAASESFFPGREAMRSVPEPARAELAELFPEMELAGIEDRIAHLVPPAAKQRRLLARHQKNAVPLFVPKAAFIHRAPSTRASVTTR